MNLIVRRITQSPFGMVLVGWGLGRSPLLSAEGLRGLTGVTFYALFPALLFRSVLTVLMHAVASGIFGYFYGLAHFSSEEVRRDHAARGRMYRLLHRIFLCNRQHLYHEAKLFEGLVIAGTYHAAYNIAASQGRIGIMLGLVGGGCAFLYYLLGLKSNREKIGAISGTRVHKTYVGRLRRRSP